MWKRQSKTGPLFLFIFLTVLTQVGGLIYLLARWISIVVSRRIEISKPGRWFATATGFSILYLAVSFLVLPPIAMTLGRLPLPCAKAKGDAVVPLNRLVCVLNRHYAAPPVHDLLAALAKHMDEVHPGTAVAYLDANFALFDGFPLLPHLSHDDGLKIDLAFHYLDANGRYRPGAAPSPLGYWGFEEPRAKDPTPCVNRSELLTLRWDMAFFQPLLTPMKLDEQRTGSMLQWLAENAGELSIDIMLLEPHLKERFGLTDPVVRFQGCRPARHDDHVHIAVMPASTSR